MSDPETSSPSGNGNLGTDPTAVPTSGGPPPNIQKLVASKRLQQAQAQVGEVVDIMRVNVEKVLERDQKISELDRRADDLQEGASQFQQHAVKLKRKYWWENIKMWIIIGIILLAVVIIVVERSSQQKNYLQCSKSNLVIVSGVFCYFHNVDYKVCHIRKVTLKIDLIQQEVPK